MGRFIATCLSLASLLEVSTAQAQANPGATTSSGSVETSATTTGSSAGPVNDATLAEARVAYQEGAQLAKQARWVDALAAFERSDALHPHPNTTYNIGYCERLLGHWTRARKMLSKALVDHEARGSVDLPADVVSASRGYLGEAERQIARVSLSITSGSLTVDGRPLEVVATVGPRPVLVAGTRPVGPPEAPPSVTFEMQVDPGPHIIVLSVNGQPDVVRNETFAPGVQISVELHVTPQPESNPVPTPAPEQPGAARPADKPNRTPAFIALGIGAAGLAAGTVSGLVAFGYKSPINSACMEASDPCHSKRVAGNTAADISTVSFIAGGVAVGVGAVLFFTASGNKAPARTGTQTAHRLAVSPSFGWGTLGLNGRF